MGFADLHVHTVHSWDGTCTVPAVLKYAADYTNLDVMAITDHDCIRGALEAIQLAPRYGIEVIPGCEISTADGHLLGLFIQKAIPAGLSLVETVHRVGEQGGICIAAHPGARVKTSLSARVLRLALQNPDVRRVLVGVESFNAGLVFSGSNRPASDLAGELHLARVGSSDAHVLETIGWGATEFAGFFADDLRRALLRGATCVCVGRSVSGAEKISRWAPRYLLRRLGWVTTNQSPFGPLRLARLSPSRRGPGVDATLASEHI
jgi:predicted metal-dependent phosphoesterase TrpH